MESFRLARDMVQEPTTTRMEISMMETGIRVRKEGQESFISK